MILSLKDSMSWLNNDLKSDQINALLTEEYPESELMIYPVSKDLFKTSVDSNVKSIVEKVEYPELVNS